MALLTLPHETITHILYHITDKTLTNMTCKLFQKLLQNLYDTKKLSNINDSYFLNKHFDNMRHKDLDQVINIHNYNCLNLIAYKLFVSKNINVLNEHLMMLIKQNCKLNNVTRPKYMKKMYQDIQTYYWVVSKTDTEMLNTTLAHKSYDMLVLLLSVQNIKKIYVSTISARFKNEKDINVITYEIDYLVKNNVLDYTEVYVKLHEYEKIHLQNELYGYLEKYVNKNIVCMYS